VIQWWKEKEEFSCQMQVIHVHMCYVILYTTYIPRTDAKVWTEMFHLFYKDSNTMFAFFIK